MGNFRIAHGMSRCPLESARFYVTTGPFDSKYSTCICTFFGSFLFFLVHLVDVAFFPSRSYISRCCNPFSSSHLLCMIWELVVCFFATFYKTKSEWNQQHFTIKSNFNGNLLHLYRWSRFFGQCLNAFYAKS